MRSYTVCQIILLALMLSRGAVAQAIEMVVGIDFISGNLYLISETTGAGGLVGNTGRSRTNSLAQDSAGTLYCHASNTLFTIDPVTASTTDVVTASTGTEVSALAFSPANVLYAIRIGTSVGDDSILITIDTTTGMVSTIGTTTGFTGLQALAFAPDGTLFAWDIREGLVTIDPTTAAVTDVNASVGGSAFTIQGIAFRSDGTLYGARDSLYTINTATGVLTLVGSGGYSDVRGIELIDVPVPPVITLGTPSPGVLWPPNGKLVSVEIRGNVVAIDGELDEVWLQVDDEYYEYDSLTETTSLLDGNGDFSTTVWLPASRNRSDKDGRTYVITVYASDDMGNDAEPVEVTVVVPHDQRG